MVLTYSLGYYRCVITKLLLQIFVLTLHISNSDAETQWTQTKTSSWRMYSIHFAPHSMNLKSKNYSCRQKASISWYLWWSKYLHVWHHPKIKFLTPCIREKKDSSSRSIKVLDHAMTGPTGTACCETFVEALGLKTLFSAFMGKVNKFSSFVKNVTQISLESHALFHFSPWRRRRQKHPPLPQKTQHIFWGSSPHFSLILRRSHLRESDFWLNSLRARTRKSIDYWRFASMLRGGWKLLIMRLNRRERYFGTRAAFHLGWTEKESFLSYRSWLPKGKKSETWKWIDGISVGSMEGYFNSKR